MRAVAIVVVLILGVEAHGQSKGELKSILDSVILKAKSTSLNSRSVNWDSVENEMHKKAKFAKTINDLRGSFECLLVALNDRHGLFYNPATTTGIAGYPYYVDPELPTAESIAKSNNAKFDFKVLSGGIGYLRMVSIPLSADVQKEAEKIRSAIDSLSKHDLQHWIVDLRYAIDGNMNPLIAGMGPLLGEGLVATAIDGKKKIRNLYSVHNGRFYDNQHLVADFPVFRKDLRNAKVAVLTSRYTSGAAEVLTIFMKGKKNVKVIGERTAGNHVCTNYLQIDKNLVMSISESQYYDRKGNVYKDKIKPDSFINFEQSADYRKDKAISEAIMWLNTTMMKENSAEKVAMN